MIEEQTSFKEKLSNSIQKVKKYPKIWISALALSCLVLGFIGGLGVNNLSNSTMNQDEMNIGKREGERFQNIPNGRNQRKSRPNTESNQDDTDADSGASQNEENQESTN